MGDSFNKGKKFRFKAKGNSMFPFILDGDVLTLEPIGTTDISVGDVTALVHPKTGNLIIHRVVRKKKNRLLIKGDNCFSNDGWVNHSWLMGIVTIIERNHSRCYSQKKLIKKIAAILSLTCLLIGYNRIKNKLIGYE